MLAWANPHPVQILLGLAILTLICVSYALWSKAFAQWQQRVPLIAAVPRGPVPWGLGDLLGLFFVFTVLLGLGVQLALMLHADRVARFADLPLNVRALVFLCDGAAKLLAVGFATLWLAARFHATWREIAWHDCTWRAVRLGAAAFALLALPVYAVQLVLVQWFEGEHPLVEIIRASPSLALFAVSFFAAAVAAPVFEEYFVRVLLQGWLENIARGDVGREDLLLGRPMQRRLPAASTPKVVAEPVVIAAEIPIEPPTAPVTRWWPIVVSSAIFAALHVGHGPDPIPLFLLALGFGYLYQRTGSVWPGIFAHACFNAWSLTLLWLSLATGD